MYEYFIIILGIFIMETTVYKLKIIFTIVIFLTFCLVSTTQNNSIDLEQMLSNRIDNLVETLAYKHEIRVVENQMNNLNIKFDSNDYLIKENDKKYYELQSEMK
jgi:hypothetical protein